MSLQAGKITITAQIQCATCPQWDDLATTLPSSTPQLQAHLLGYRYRRLLGWQCQHCREDKPE